MVDFYPAGGVPQGYGELLNAARQQLVRMPDGSYVIAPQFGSATNLEELYRGILPSESPPSPLATRRVETVPVDAVGNPIIEQRGEQRRPQMINSGAIRTAPGSQSAGQTQLPPGVRPSAVDEAFALLTQGQPQRMPMQRPFFPSQVDSMGRFNPAPGPIDLLAKTDQSRLPVGQPGLVDPLSAFGPQAENQALAAIAANAGPRLPMAMPASIAAQRQPQVPLPRPRPNVSQPSSPGMIGAPYTIKKGDTLSHIAKRTGTTVSALAAANGISNPNKIYAGQKISLVGMANPPSSSSSSSTSAPRQSSAPARSSSTPAPPPGKPAGYGSKGYSEAGKLLQQQFGF